MIVVFKYRRRLYRVTSERSQQRITSIPSLVDVKEALSLRRLYRSSEGGGSTVRLWLFNWSRAKEDKSSARIRRSLLE